MLSRRLLEEPHEDARRKRGSERELKKCLVFDDDRLAERATIEAVFSKQRDSFEIVGTKVYAGWS